MADVPTFEHQGGDDAVTPRSITVAGLWLQFDADQVSKGTDEEQAVSAIELINSVLQRQPYGLGAQLLGANASIEIVQVPT